MLFTVGASYFLFLNSANSQYNQNLLIDANALDARLNENMVISTTLLPDGNIGFFLNDTGGLTINATEALLTDSSGSILACFGLGITPPSGVTCQTSITRSPTGSTSFPLVFNPGRGNPPPSDGYFDTGKACDTTVCDLKIITQHGNLFTQTYPNTGVSLAAQALSSGAIGDLYLAFQTYHYFTVYTSGCTAGGGFSGYCIADQGKAFAIDHSLMASNYNMAFSVSITDLNQQRANIVLDPYTLMTLVPESGKGALSYIPWFIISNETNRILSVYTPIVLTYDIPVTVVFASGFPLTSGTSFTNGDLQSVGTIAAGITTPVFMVSHGCEGSGITTCVLSRANYGQNSPYVTTLFY